MTPFCWDAFRAVPIVGILRGLPTTALDPVIVATRAGGLTTVEITMDTVDAEAQIRHVRRLVDGHFNVGAGTVTSRPLLDRALDAGASFIVTPTVQPEVIAACVARGVPVFPGALSPSEVIRATEFGASWVKVFPADHLGPAHVRRLHELLPGTGLMPTGGVDMQTLPAFLEAGAAAFGIGSPLFDRRRIERKDWDWLRRRCAGFREAVTTASTLTVDRPASTQPA